MKVRPFSVYDLEAVDRIHRGHHEDGFAMPSLHNTLRSIVVESDRREKGGLGPGGLKLEPGEIVAFGTLKLIPEAIMVLDLNQPLPVKVKALRSLIMQASSSARQHGYDGFHAFVQSGSFSEELKEHFGFVTCKGEALYLDGDK